MNNRVMGERIREMRIKKGYTQEELGEVLKCAKSTISAYENNYNKPDIYLLRQIANILETSIDYLAGNTDNPELPLTESIFKINDKIIKIRHAIDAAGISEELLLEMIEYLADKKKKNSDNLD